MVGGSCRWPTIRGGIRLNVGLTRRSIKGGGRASRRRSKQRFDSSVLRERIFGRDRISSGSLVELGRSVLITEISNIGLWDATVQNRTNSRFCSGLTRKERSGLLVMPGRPQRDYAKI